MTDGWLEKHLITSRQGVSDDEVKKWCRENCRDAFWVVSDIGGYSVFGVGSSVLVVFDSSEDAMHFKLVWS
jgi:hypothetical protein